MMESTGSLRTMFHHWTLVGHGQRGEYDALSIASLTNHLLVDERLSLSVVVVSGSQGWWRTTELNDSLLY